MKALEILHEKSEDGTNVFSPAVGKVGHLPINGCLVSSKGVVGTLEILGTTHLLILPVGLQGKVTDADEEFLLRPVFYGERLFSLAPIEKYGSKDAKKSEEEDKVAGRYLISALTQGIFYHRPSPESPPYVELGATVKTGQVLGLVEVMKCFNQVVYSGPGLPETAKVIEVCVKDGAEVQYRQPLFYFE